MDIEEKVQDTLETVGRSSARNPRRVFLGVALIILVSAFFAATSVQMSMGMNLYIDHNSQTWEDWSHLKTEFDEGNNVFVVVESNTLYDPATIR
ncbi:MAG: RND family transporter, partial [Halobacteria archaeon]|nr:RND family transporter [Halobacteria archaeon]